jgi:hypothetical protein
LVAKKPKKDAYKGQATYNHPCSAVQYHIDQGFKLGYRQLIVTDITYLYYDNDRKNAYLCAFKDAYTNEILGWSVSKRMDIKLVTEAYDMMMNNHGDEFKNVDKCYINSDQGSVYLSTTFKELLKNDNLVQSMSRRGNSQDNAPIESFFSRFKHEALDTIARCDNFDIVVELVDGYMDTYNKKRFQYECAGLTPSEFYKYCITGIYPLDNYFGVKASKLMSLEDIVNARLEEAKKKSEKARESSRKRKREQALLANPCNIITNDIKKITKQIEKWENTVHYAQMQVDKFKDLLDSIIKARLFYHNATTEIRNSLRDAQNWKMYHELNYVHEIKDLY